MSRQAIQDSVDVSVNAVADLSTLINDVRVANGTRVWVSDAGVTQGLWLLNQSSSAIVDGSTVVATLSGVGRWIYFGAGLAGVSSSTVNTVWFLGDSIWEGTGSEDGPRGRLFAMLQLYGYNISFVGSVSSGARTQYQPGEYEHDGHPGANIPNTSANFAAYRAALSTTPKFGLLCIGTNDSAGGAAAALVNLAALLATLRAQATIDGTIWIVTDIPMNASINAYVTAYNAGIPAVVAAAGPQFRFVPAFARCTQADFPINNSHPYDTGSTKCARALSDALIGLFSRPLGIPWPRQFRRRYSQSAILLANAADSCVFAANPAHDPGAGDFVTEIVWTPNGLGAGNRVIYAYGNALVSGYAIIQNGTTITLFYLGNPIASVPDVVVDQTTIRIAVVGTIGFQGFNRFGLFINGVLGAIANVVGAWGMVAGQNAYVGNWPAIAPPVTGWIDNLRICKGAQTPRYAHEARVAVEKSYAEGDPIDGTTALYRFNDAAGVAPADAAGGAPGAFAAGTWGVPVRPWNDPGITVAT